MNEITYAQRKQVYEAALRSVGADMQMWLLVEEMGELAQALSKYKRELFGKERLVDEIADVTIMLEQLRVLLECNDSVCRKMDSKVMRLCFRLGIEPEYFGICAPEALANALNIFDRR